MCTIGVHLSGYNVEQEETSLLQGLDVQRPYELNKQNISIGAAMKMYLML